MKIAEYNEHRYEFIEGKEEGTVVLLSNGWQQDFDIEEIEGQYFYTKHVQEEETESLWESNLMLSLTKDGVKVRVSLIDTPEGNIVEFEDEKLSYELKELITEKKAIFSEEPFSMTYEDIKEAYPEVTLWKERIDQYEDSYFTKAISVMEAVTNSVTYTKISARKIISDCGYCGYKFPYNNSKIRFDEEYTISCPLCGKKSVKKRT